MNPMPANVEPMDKLLFFGIMLFVILLIGVSKWSPNDGQTFQVLSGCLTGFVGAFLGRMQPSAKKTQPPDGVTTTQTISLTEPKEK